MLAIPRPTVVECMLIVGLIVSDWGCEAFQPFLSHFGAIFIDFDPILTQFSLFRATGNLLKAPHVPSDGVREALGMHLGRRGSWAGPGKGINLKISRAPHHTPMADLQRFRRCGPPWSQKKRRFLAQSTPSRAAP